MSRRQLLNSLIKEEENEQKIKKQMQDKKALICFLKNKLKESLDTPKYYKLENSPALNKIRNDFEKLPLEKQEQLESELEKELSNANYNA